MINHWLWLVLITATLSPPSFCHGQQVDLPENLRDLPALLKEHSDYEAIKKSEDKGLRALVFWMEDSNDPLPSEIVLVRRSDMLTQPSRRLAKETRWIEVRLQKRLQVTVIPGDHPGVQVQSLAGMKEKSDTQEPLVLSVNLGALNAENSLERLTSIESAIEALSSVEQMKRTLVLFEFGDRTQRLALDEFLNVEGGVAIVKCGRDKASEDYEGGRVFECVLQSPRFRIDLDWNGSKWLVTGAQSVK